ncbi:hypothetical protein [Litorihabitans aurantiacus]|uniref:Uncharacterized protein n=1 Tax=Litorihabitans aurantiacus TaxID=1930061 RepID=A0AA37XDS7_9MICO|nr:hypothetical protein [Litorihabitans aurantiacus]GMA30917.1 hypothetical protein GCM10025875_09090 [Litorihabitans aurantiacus]
MSTWRFDGAILGVGSTSGVRAVVGMWSTTPFGPFADAMVSDAAGRRTLVAPSERVATFIAETYSFDDVVIARLRAHRDAHEVAFDGGGLHLRARLGSRDALGRALTLLPRGLATHPGFSRAVSPAARAVAGVRTYGTAGRGRTEAYGATDRRRVLALAASWHGEDLGDLADVDPPVRFGFSSTPRASGLTRVTTTVAARARHA